MVSQGQAEEHATHKCHAGELNSSLLSAIQDTVVECAGIKVKLQAAKPENYAELRTLAAGVSSCSDVHSSEDVQALFAIPTFHPVSARRVDSGELVGYAELYRLPHMGRSFDGRLERVVVDESFRGRNLATEMCKYIIAEAKRLQCNRIDLTVEADSALHIYKNKLGFVPISTTVLRLKM
eukprot:Lankesteria_metandrocarpae@DN2407_c0_g1_i1.p1